MTSSYTTNKHLEQPAHGDYADTWQIPVNGNMGEIDAALGGTTLLSTTSGAHTLTVSEYQSAFLSISGTLTGSVTYTIPSGVGGQWTFDTTAVVLGGFTVTLASGGGGSVVLPGGQTGLVFTNGTFVKLSVSGSGGGGTPGGSDTQVQYNSSGSFAGTSAITVAGSVATINTLVLTNDLLPANGGTGVSTLPANSVIVGAGTSPVTGVAPGNAGNGLISNGTVWASAAIPPGLWNAGTVTTIGAGLTLSTGTVALSVPVSAANGGTGLTALGTGVSAALGAAVTGAGGLALANSATLTTPALGTPSAAVLTNATGLPLTSGVTGALPAANGGTGLTAPGTSGNVLTSNGAGWTSAAPTIAPNIQTFASSGTWTKPAIGTRAIIEFWGPGQGGGRSVSTPGCCGPTYDFYPGSPGLFGSIECLLSDLTTTVAVTIGAGGAGVANQTLNYGGTTSFGAYFSIAGATITSAGLTLIRSNLGFAGPTGGGLAGAATASVFGGTGGSGSFSTNGGNGAAPGGGGGSGGLTATGGNGAAGQFRITVV